LASREDEDGPRSAAPRLARAFFARDTITVARALLGCALVCRRTEGEVRGRIVETEAYLGRDDPASHAAWHRSGRFAAMWGPAGIAYIYRSYGIHAMLNVVADQDGLAGAVLLRAVKPEHGVDLMRRRRSVDAETRLASGPGRLCQAFGISLADHGRDLTTDREIWFEASPAPVEIDSSPRVGISRGVDLPWRFFVPDSRFLSARRPTSERPHSSTPGRVEPPVVF